MSDPFLNAQTRSVRMCCLRKRISIPEGLARAATGFCVAQACADSRLDCTAEHNEAFRCNARFITRIWLARIVVRGREIRTCTPSITSRHHLRRDRSEQNAVAKMAGGDVVAGSCGCAENGQSVGSSGTQAGPVFENFGVPQFRNQVDRGAMQALNRGRRRCACRIRLLRPWCRRGCVRRCAG